MKTLIAFILLCGIASASESPCQSGKCTMTAKKTVKTVSRPIRRIFRGR